MISDIRTQLIVLIGAIVVMFLVGFKTASHIKDNEITKIKDAHLIELGEARAVALAANENYRSLESRTATAIGAITDNYEQARQNEKTISDHAIADLLSDNKRLRVSVRNAAAPRSSVPGAPTGPVVDTDQTEQTLSGPVAARLTGRYADYNEVVDQLSACQAALIADRQMK